MRGKCNRDKSQNKTFTIILDFDNRNKRSHQFGSFAQSGEDKTSYSKSASTGVDGAKVLNATEVASFISGKW